MLRCILGVQFSQNMRISLSFWLLTASLLLSCAGKKEPSLKEKTVTAKQESAPDRDSILAYQGAHPLDFRVLHTEMDLKPDWNTSRMNGTVIIKLQVGAYPQDSLVLDAKGMDIERVEHVGSDFFAPLKYQYDGLELRIALPYNMSPGESFKVLVGYVAKPEERKTKSGRAISDSKGLYFINPRGEDPGKPTQLWTQGEPESNSNWFPTIDKPNQKMTQSVRITVDKKYKTLCNGELDFSYENPDGSRTDVWVLEKPHAPYLSMLAVGEFHVAKGKWRDKDLLYYVEPEYAPWAEKIFNHTPEMLEFFSKKLGVDYPWDKFGQVAVRDYVSGAMENTGAVIFGEFVQKNGKQLADDHNDGIVAHEMFHHWFGDLITCESWSDLSVNESFATYSEILWNEHHEGQASMEYAISRQNMSVTATALRSESPIVRHFYTDPDQMFDGNTYGKGSRVIHTLRRLLGEEVFFKCLKTFLTRYAHQAVEVDHFRLVCEEVSGRDLKLFFNQWWHREGMPSISSNWSWNDSTGTLTVDIHQKQKHLFDLYPTLEIQVGSELLRYPLRLTSRKQQLTYKLKASPTMVVLDPNKQLLMDVEEKAGINEWMARFNFYKGGFSEKDRALKQIVKLGDETQKKSILLNALSDSFWGMRQSAIRLLRQNLMDERITEQLLALAQKDPNAVVRAAAWESLILWNTSGLTEPMKKALLADSSYMVSKVIYPVLASRDSLWLLNRARVDIADKPMMGVSSKELGKFGNLSDSTLFEQAYWKSGNMARVTVLTNYTAWGKRLGLPGSQRVIRFAADLLKRFPRSARLKDSIRSNVLKKLDDHAGERIKVLPADNPEVRDWQTLQQDIKALGA